MKNISVEPEISTRGNKMGQVQQFTAPEFLFQSTKIVFGKLRSCIVFKKLKEEDMTFNRH